MTTIDSVTDLKRMAAQARVNALVVLGVPVAVFAALAAWLGTPQVLPAALGAAGWMIALALRQPIALIASRVTTKERTMTVVGWASGPAEEVVRLLLVLFVLRTGSAAAWAGAGWMAVEVAMVTVNGLMMASLLTKDDPKSIEAKDFLSEQGMMQNYGPWWGVVERFSAAGLHIGFTLLIFAQPWLAVVTIVVHSCTNMLVVRYAKRSIALTVRTDHRLRKHHLFRTQERDGSSGAHQAGLAHRVRHRQGGRSLGIPRGPGGYRNPDHVGGYGGGLRSGAGICAVVLFACVAGVRRPLHRLDDTPLRAYRLGCGSGGRRTWCLRAGVDCGDLEAPGHVFTGGPRHDALLAGGRKRRRGPLARADIAPARGCALRTCLTRVPP